MDGTWYASARCQINMNGECLTDPEWCEADLYGSCGSPAPHFPGRCPPGNTKIPFPDNSCYCARKTCKVDSDCKWAGKGGCGIACYNGGCFQREWLAGKNIHPPK